MKECVALLLSVFLVDASSERRDGIPLWRLVFQQEFKLDCLSSLVLAGGYSRAFYRSDLWWMNEEGDALGYQ